MSGAVYRVRARPRERPGADGCDAPVGRVVAASVGCVKKVVALLVAAGAVHLARRQRAARPAADVWRDATRTTSP